jgi:hypothetical protein
MAEPDWNPDTGGRSLAEILREAGIENANRQSRRRRWDDPDEAGLRQRRAEAAAAERAGYGRRKGDLPFDEPPPVERRQSPRRAPDPATAAIPGLRPDRKPGVPPAGPMPSAPVPSAPVPSDASVRERGPEERFAQRGERSPQRGERSPQRASQPVRTLPEDEHFSTGPIPVVRPEDLDDDVDSTPRESALAWLRFVGELVIALAAGIGIYFTATLLWENVPYLAVLLVPVAVTGLVAGVGAWRQRQGRDPVGPRLLAILVVAGTLLTIAPAAGLLAAA